MPLPANTCDCGLPDLYVEGIAAVRKGDAYAPHACPTCPAPPHPRSLSAGSGTVSGAEVQRVGSASLYLITAGAAGLPFVGGAPGFLFNGTTIVNSGGGTISASIGQLEGVWSVDQWFNLYSELGYSSAAECVLQNTSPNYAQPFRDIPGMNPVLAELPPPGCDLSEATFDPMALLNRWICSDVRYP